MTDERRRHPRLSQPVEGLWAGASGSGRCRVSDVGMGGCFVQALTAPAAGEMTTIALNVAGHSLSLTGRVAYVDPGIGFGMEFQAMPDQDRELLREFLNALAGNTSAP